MASKFEEKPWQFAGAFFCPETRVCVGLDSSIGNIVGTSNDGEEIYIGAYVGDSKTDSSPRYSLLRVKTPGKGVPRVAIVGNGSGMAISCH